MSLEVHWHEGLFLQPHHLQRLQRGLIERNRTAWRSSWHYPYGVVNARLFPDELENGQVRFEKLHVIMPNGVEVRVPEWTELPSLGISGQLTRNTGGFAIHLGVPIRKEGRLYSLESEADSRVKTHYRLREVECDDENTGDHSQKILLREINARLLLEQDDRSDLETLPLLRIQRAFDREKDVPREDSGFVPPCLVVGGSPVLQRIVTELAAKVESIRDDLAPRLAAGGMGADVRLERTLRLRTLAHFGGSLPSLAESRMTPPFDLYLSLRQLLGELAALIPAEVDSRCAPYNHDDPLPCFEELDQKIRRALKERKDNVLEIPFDSLTPAGNPRASLTGHDLTTPTAFYLGIRTNIDRTDLTNYVRERSKFKLMPESLEGSAIFGIELRGENFPPPELPPQPGRYYFKALLREGPRWPAIQRDQATVLEWSRSEIDLSDAAFTLYLTLPA
jgi:type VI secretion system ImpJ/VasE family protein